MVQYYRTIGLLTKLLFPKEHGVSELKDPIILEAAVRRLCAPGLAFAALLLVCYWPMLARTGVLLSGGDDMAHGFFAPIVSLFIIWRNKDRILAGAGHPSALGLAALFLAALLALAANLGGSTTFQRFAFLGSLGGAALVLGGFGLLRQLIFPILLLLFTFPLPGVLYGEITQPLQLTASRLSELTFELLGYSVLREGNILQLAHTRLSVVEACSGIRSLSSLAFFCLSYIYFFDSRAWVRALIVAAAVPAAIMLNVLRIVGTGLLAKYNPAWTHGPVHDTMGWTAFVIGFAMVFAFHRVLIVFIGHSHNLGEPQRP